MPVDDKERRRWQNPEAILAGIGLKPGFTFIDLGCGSGFFALPAARIVGESGKVYGVDVNAGAIAALKEQSDKEGLQNISLAVAKAEEVLLCERCADIIFIGIALHDFQNPSIVLENARKMVKPAGFLFNLDWKKEPTPFGPPISIRFDEKTAAGMIKAAGFNVDCTADNGPYHYIITARPSLSHAAAIGCRIDV